MTTFNKETILSVASSFDKEIERLTTERDRMYLDLIVNHKEIWNHLQKEWKSTCGEYIKFDFSYLNSNILKGKNLSNLILVDSNLSYLDLSDTNLNGANLINVNFYKANLTGVNLSQANLLGADLFSATLINANLTEANLIEVKAKFANFSYYFD